MAEAADTKIIFLVHLSDISSGTKAKGQKSTKKAKTKELEMETSDTPENYLTFLTGLLSKFGENSDFITENNTFPFQYYHSSSKKMDAITVENSKEYAEMIQSLQALKITKPKGKTNILVDMDTAKLFEPSSVSIL